MEPKGSYTDNISPTVSQIDIYWLSNFRNKYEVGNTERRLQNEIV